MSTKVIKFLYVTLIFRCVIAQQRISVLKCDETLSLRTDPRSLHPHLVEILTVTSPNEISLISHGTLISEDFVLTSAINLQKLPLIFGHLRVRKSKVTGDQYSNSQMFTVKDLIPYDSGETDFGLLQLNEIIPYHNRVSIFRPACIWTETQVPSSYIYSIYGTEYLKYEEILNGVRRVIPGNIIDCTEISTSDFNITNLNMCLNINAGNKYYVTGSPIDANVGEFTYVLGIISQSFYKDVYSHHVATKTSSLISWIESTVWPNFIEEKKLVCGQRKITHGQRINNGRPTYHGEFPWHVAVYRLEGGREKNQKYICGGTIINNRTILTAAHCVKNELGILSTNRLIIVAGIHNLNENTMDTQNYVVDMITVHNEYNRHHLENDLALLKLSGSIEFSNYIQPICLTNPSITSNMAIGTVVGWGNDENNQPSDVLLQAPLPIRTNTECRQSNRDFFNTYLNDKNFCAGSESGTNVCSGDSGGGMVFHYNSRWYLRGIVSVGVAVPNSNRCDVTQMVLFTDIPKFYDWIVSNL